MSLKSKQANKKEKLEILPVDFKKTCYLTKSKPTEPEKRKGQEVVVAIVTHRWFPYGIVKELLLHLRVVFTFEPCNHQKGICELSFS